MANGVQGPPDGGCDRMCNDSALLVLTVTGGVVAIHFLMVVRILAMGAMTRWPTMVWVPLQGVVARHVVV